MPRIRRPLDDYRYDKNKEKAVLFFSAGSVGDINELRDFGIKETLVSYFYLRKALRRFNDLIKDLHKDGGIFMTDSGAFSFMGSAYVEEMNEPDYWIPYLEEYVSWLRENKEYIFVAANLDLDKVVGRDAVREWNKKYFEPLEKEGLQIVYVAHEDDETDPHAIGHFTEYCKKYRYVGINQSQKKYASRFFQIAKMYDRKVHGFAWTELNILKHYPFFTVDSTTWLGGLRYGSTYDYDGKNFRTWDFKNKHKRKSRRTKYREIGVELTNVYGKEIRPEVNKMNLLGWMGFRKEYLKMAKLKLHNRIVGFYCNKH